MSFHHLFPYQPTHQNPIYIFLFTLATPAIFLFIFRYRYQKPCFLILAIQSFTFTLFSSVPNIFTFLFAAAGAASSYIHINTDVKLKPPILVPFCQKRAVQVWGWRRGALGNNNVYIYIYIYIRGDLIIFAKSSVLIFYY